MNVLGQVYLKGLEENENKLRSWEHYLDNLKKLDFNLYSDRLKVPILVPIGNRILFRGELVHTNEVTVALGANYFAKCSTAQAEILRQHRITGATKNVELFKKEKEYFENHLNFSKENVFSTTGHEIIEPYIKENEELWREKHKENVRKHKQKKNDMPQTEKLTDEELWTRLEELELQEELEQEYLSMKDDTKEHNFTGVPSEINIQSLTIENIIDAKRDIAEHELMYDIEKKYEIDNRKDLNEILNRQKVLEQQLLEIKNRERRKAKNEEDLMVCLDEMEELELIEDEIDRIDGELDDTHDTIEETNAISKNGSKKTVSFADEDDAQTAQLCFTHSDILPSLESYDPKKGINKPSDIYTAFSHLLDCPGRTISILRKSVYNHETNAMNDLEAISREPENVQEVEPVETIVIKDIKEKNAAQLKPVAENKRPQSLFKMKRTQKQI